MTTKISISNKYIIGTAFAVVVFFMGVNYLFINISNAELPPLWGAALRYLMSSIILYLVLKAKKIKFPKGLALKGAIIYGALSYGANAGLLYWAMNQSSSSIASVVYATIPLSTLLLASSMGFDKLTKKSLLSSIAVIAGITIIFANRVSSYSSMVSILAIVLASLLASLSGILINKYPKSNPLACNMVAMATGGTILLFLSSITGENITLPQLATTWVALGWLISSSIIAFGLLIWLIRKISPAKVSYVSVLSPLVTIVASTILSIERLSPALVIGSIIVLIGSANGIKQNYNLDKK